MPTIRRILETALYFDDVARAAIFYRDVLELGILVSSERLVARDAGGATVLLLFRRGASLAGIETSGGKIPSHDGLGQVHVAFAIAQTDVSAWEERLAAAEVPIESRVEWEGGGRSLYFRDPEGHSVELATPGTWTTY